ncbi:MAG: hypothetical protein JSS39_01160 [Nitrospira sp.]|nr:hypothetical protein [Nitrospira sp.]
MASIKTKEDFIRKYAEYKMAHGVVPKQREFLKYVGAHSRKLTALWGRDAYSKLQSECGDDPNKLDFERTPLEVIMRQYGDLALELGDLPNSSDWIYRDLRPSIAGLVKKPHFIKWAEFPRNFADWVKSSGADGYAAVVALIDASFPKTAAKVMERDREFEKLVNDIRLWSPARRRNSEGEYKVELRGYLQSHRYQLNEEYGESSFDLLVRKKYAIEIKKDPKLSDYDRLFGQLARHLQHQLQVVALILDVPSEDNLENFSSLVDEYLNRGKKTVEVIKK